MPEESSSYIKEWQEINPEWKILLWNEQNSPMEVPYMQKAYCERKWANMSNFIRLFALLEKGGIYLDTDVKLIKPLDSFCSDQCFLGFEEGGENSDEFWVNNAVCGAVKEHPFIKDSFTTLLDTFDGSEMANLSGPRMTTQLLKDSRSLTKYGYQQLQDVTLYPKEFFYPIHYSELYKIANLEQHLSPETVAVHVWARTWLSKQSLLTIIDDLYRINARQLQVADKQYFNKSIIEELSQSVYDLKAQLEQRNEQARESCRQQNHLSENNRQLTEQLTAAYNQITVFQADLVSQKENAAILHNSCNDYAKIAEEKKTELDRALHQLDSQSVELIQLRQELRRNEEKNILVEKFEERHMLSIINLRQKEEQLISQYKGHLKTEKEKGLYLEQLCNEYKSDIEELKQKEKELNAQFCQQQQKASEKDDLLLKTTNGHISIIDELRQREKALLKRMDDLLSTNENQTREISLLINEIDSLREQAHSSQLMARTVKQELQEKDDDVQILNEKINELGRETEELCRELTGANRHLNNDIFKYEQKVFSLDNELKSLQKAITWYQDTYEKRSLAGIAKDRIIKRAASIKQVAHWIHGYHKIKKSKRSSQLGKKILCSVVNYNCTENALKLRKHLSRYFDTVVFDSGSESTSSKFINLGNVYYSGLLNNAYACAKSLGYDFLFFICSDVEFQPDEIENMFHSFRNTNLDEVGLYSPSSIGRSHSFCKRVFKKGLRAVPFVEGFVFMADIKVLGEFLPIDLHVNQYGWGLDLANGYFARKLNKLSLIDDGVSVYHPESTGYSNQKAETDMWHWVNGFPDEDFKRFFNTHIDIIRRGKADDLKVSVIVPCYNQAQYLKETLFSIFLQEYSNFEILLVNDGSTDNTEEVAKQIAGNFSQVRYLHKENGGLGSARNYGLEHATGDLIQFLDSDDLLSRDKFLAQVWTMLRQPDIQVSYSPYICFEDGNAQNTWTYSRVILESDALADLIQNWEKDLSIPVHCFLYRRAAIEDVRFDEELPNHEDWLFHLFIAAKNPLYHFENNGLANYRVRTNSMARDRDLMKKGKEMCIRKAIGSGLMVKEYIKALENRLEVPVTS